MSKRSPWQYLLPAGAVGALSFGDIASGLNPNSGLSATERATKLGGTALGFTGLGYGVGAAASGLPYLFSPEAAQNLGKYGNVQGTLRNIGGFFNTGLSLEPFLDTKASAERFAKGFPKLEDTIARENLKTQQFGSGFGQFLGQQGGRGFDTVQNKFTLDVNRTNPLNNQKFTTRVEGDKYVLVERPNPLRPNEKTRTYVKESEYKDSPTGSVVGTGYAVPRTNPLTGKLENTIVDEAQARALGAPITGTQPSIDLSGVGRDAYNAAMGAANSEYQIGKKAAQRDLRTMLQQLGQTATGVGLDTSMAAAQAGMDTSPGALDVGLDYIEGARAQGEAGARGDFAKTLGQLEQRRLRQQASAAQAAAQAQQNAVLNLYLASQGLL